MATHMTDFGSARIENTFVEKFASLALLGDERTAWQITRGLIHENVPSAVLFESLIHGAMNHIHDMWLQNEVSSPEQLLAASVSEYVIRRYHHYSKLVPHFGPSAMVFTLEGEPHHLGARMVAHILAETGWDVTYLGFGEEEHSLIWRVMKIQPRCVAISCTIESSLEQLSKVLPILGDMNRCPFVLVGGRVVGGAHVDVRNTTSIKFLANLKELTIWSRQHVHCGGF